MSQIIDVLEISSFRVTRFEGRFEGYRIITFNDVKYNFPTCGNIDPDIKLKNRNIQLIYLNYLKTIIWNMAGKIENIMKTLIIDHDYDYDYDSDIFDVGVYVKECASSVVCGGAGGGVYDIYDYAAHLDKVNYEKVDVSEYSKIFEDAYSDDIELSVPASSYLSGCKENAGYARVYFEHFINKLKDLSTSTGRYKYSYSDTQKATSFRNIFFLITEQYERCEKFGVKIASPELLMSNKLKELYYRHSPPKGDGGIFACIIELTLEYGPHSDTELIIYNEHNGYSPHDYFISFNDYYVTGSL